MRMQWAIFCDRQEVTSKGERNLFAVFGERRIPADKGYGRVRLKGTVVVSLMEGKPGPHKFWLVIQAPDGPPDIRPVMDFVWPEGSTLHMIDYQVDLIEKMAHGIWECRVLVDGDIMGVCYLPSWYVNEA